MMDATKTTMIAVFLLCVVTAKPAGGQTLDVCASCHVNATCSDKFDGSGKVCHCKYGFVGNGRTFCQDKDECQIGASKICGLQTTCHNTYGSYYCTCLSGYSPTNNMDVFIPNDGTYCRVVDCGRPAAVENMVLLSAPQTTYESVAMFACDEGFVWRSGANSSECGADGRWIGPTAVCEDIDECRSISGLCGDGGLCRNLKGSFDCSCQPGYQVHNGPEPFNPHTNKAFCKLVDCGRPAAVENMVLLSAPQTTYDSVAMFACDEGFVWRSGANSSECGADGRWIGPTAVCEDIDECRSISGLCGDGGLCRNLKGSFDCSCQPGYQVHNGPEPFNPHTNKAFCKLVDCGRPAAVENMVLLSAPQTTYDSVAMFACDEGFVWRSGANSSECGADGRWIGPTAVCEDIDECRSISGLCGDGGLCRNLKGSFDCSCQPGYQVHNGPEPFNPHTNKAFCKLVDCGRPAAVENMVLLSAPQTTYDSVAMFACDEGFVWRSGANSSECGADGRWIGPTAVCEGVDCGSPLTMPHSHILWNKSSRMGAEVQYQCHSGYHNVGKGNVSMCTAAGQWERPTVLCQETLCGFPPVIESTEQVWNNKSTPGSTALYFCKEGFRYKGGHNVSTCSGNGQWTRPTLSCQAILCGDPPILPCTGQIWEGNSEPGSTVTYFCKPGFYHSGGNNISSCTISGNWTQPDISCKEVDCGVPPHVPHSVKLWDNISTVGSQVVYQCNPGYQTVGEGNVSVCSADGGWDGASLFCQEINCQRPVFKPHAKMLWDGTSHLGSVVRYQCEEGYHSRSLRNVSVCGESGLWEDTDMWCEDIRCGPPLKLPHTNLVWDGTSTPGSVVLYECMDGFYQESGHNVSACLLSGEWGEVSVKCKAKCGPVPILENSEVLWHNRSVVIHRCVDGYHSWRGSNMSVCSSSGVWENASMKCVELKPPVTHLFVVNERCVHWRAEKYEDDTEVYKVTRVGSRDYQRSFRDKRTQYLRSKADQLEMCLNLLPVTNYSISITAVSARFTATITTNTSLTAPPAPVVYFREFETPVPTLKLRRSLNTLDPISTYQVFVLPVEGVMSFDCSSPESRNKPPAEYIAAMIEVRHVGMELNFTVGDGLFYGGCFNARLESGRNYYIFLRAVSQWNKAVRSTCVLWAKVRGTSHVMMVSAVSAAASVVFVAVIMLGGFIWCFKKT